MAREVYSKRFLAGTVDELSPDTAGPVPAGYVWVVRDMTAYAYGFGDASYPGFTFSLEIESFEPVMIWGAPLAYLGRQYSWQGRVVMNAGDSLTVAGAGSTYWDVTISGYQLTLP